MPYHANTSNVNATNLFNNTTPGSSLFNKENTNQLFPSDTNNSFNMFKNNENKNGNFFKSEDNMNKFFGVNHHNVF